MSIDITDRFMAAAGGNIARGDLFVCDVQSIDREKCAALIAFDPNLNIPSMDAVFAYVRTAFAGKIVPQMVTAKVHPHEHAISVVLSSNPMTRAASDTATMRKVTATLFSDDKAQSLWSLVTSNDGQRYLVQNVNEPVADLVARCARRNPFHPDARLATLKSAAPIVFVGDSCKFFGNLNQTLFGVITNIDGDTVSIKTSPDGNSHTVSRFAIAEVTARSAKEQSAEKSRAEDFYAQIWNSRELAQKFVQRGVNDDGTGNNQSPVFPK